MEETHTFFFSGNMLYSVSAAKKGLLWRCFDGWVTLFSIQNGPNLNKNRLKYKGSL